MKTIVLLFTLNNLKLLLYKPFKFFFCSPIILNILKTKTNQTNKMSTCEDFDSFLSESERNEEIQNSNIFQDFVEYDIKEKQVKSNDELDIELNDECQTKPDSNFLIIKLYLF